ncbi:MAG: hypothetical protein KIS83_09930 [Rubrivivax sp.]|nr:hypothetical protein [Rubrivivax sp.]
MMPDPLHDAAEPVAAPEAVRAGRRRLLRGGLASAPVLLSLTSRPVTATTCTQASSHASVNMSRMDQMYTCGGHGPDYWKQPQHAQRWPSRFNATSSTNNNNQFTPMNSNQATLFDDVFGASGGYAGMTFLQVLSLNATGGRDGLARHCVAAVLNANAGLTPTDVLSEVTTKNIWASFVSRGYYEPTAGIKWYPDYAVPDSPMGGLIAWMRTTMPA